MSLRYAKTELTRSGLQRLISTGFITSSSLSFPTLLPILSYLPTFFSTHKGIGSDSRRKYQVVLFPNSQKNSHLYKTLESTLANHAECQLLPVARKYYDETEGQKQISELMVRIEFGG